MAKEPGAHINLVYYYHPEKNLYIINECTVIEAHREFHEDLNKIYHLSFILECVDKTTAEDNHEGKIFDILLAGIKTLVRTEQYSQFSSFFILHLLKLHGILPPFGECKSCGKIEPAAFHLDGTDLREICSECAPASWSRNNAGPCFTKSAQAFLKHTMTRKFGDMDRGACPERELHDLLLVLGNFIEQYYHVRLKTKPFVLNSALQSP